MLLRTEILGPVVSYLINLILRNNERIADLKLGRLYLERGQYLKARGVLAGAGLRWNWQPLEAYKAKKLMERAEQAIQDK